MVRGFLTAATSLIVEYKLWDAQASVVVAPWLQSTGSVVVVRGVSGPTA